MQLLGYLRVSSTQQAEKGLGLDVQEDAIRDWVELNGHELVGIIRDAGVSGTKPAWERPGLTDVLVRLDRGDAEGLVTHRLDRLSRQLTHQEGIISHIWRSGARIFTADSGEVLMDDPSDPMRTAFRLMAGVFAQLERALLIKRAHDTMMLRKSRGEYVGVQPPFGSRLVEGHLEPHEVEQATVARIIELRGEGMTLQRICLTLDREHHRTREGGPWYESVLCSILERHEPKGIYGPEKRYQAMSFGWRRQGFEVLSDARAEEALALMASLRARRFSLQEIADELNHKGFTTKRGCSWSVSSVSTYIPRSATDPSDHPPRPFGVKKSRGKQVLDRSETVALKKMIRLRETGAAWDAIAGLLNAQGVPTRNRARWYGSSVRWVVVRVRPDLAFQETGGIPFGMELGKRGLRCNRRERAILETIDRLTAEGMSRYAVAKHLNSRGMLSRHGGRWTYGTVDSLLNRPDGPVFKSTATWNRGRKKISEGVIDSAVS